MFHSPLERDIENSATGDHQKVLFSLSPTLLLPFFLLYQFVMILFCYLVLTFKPNEYFCNGMVSS